MKLIVTTIKEDIVFDIPKESDKTVLEQSLHKDLNGTQWTFILFTDADGRGVWINKNNIISVEIKEK